MTDPAPSILVVDDMATTRTLLAGVLGDHGYRIETAAGGKEALALLQDERLDLLLLDVVMPGIDGFQVLQAVRKRFSALEFPVIVVTAKHASEDIVQALELGANDYISKPIDFAILLARIKTLLASKQAEDRLRQAHAELEKRVEVRTQELQRSNAALQAGERRYRILYDYTPSMFFTLDPDGKILSVNQFGARQLGYKRTELVGLPMSRLLDDSTKASAEHHLRLCLQDPESVHRWENRKLRKDGSSLWVRETCRVVKGHQGKPTVFIVCEDITDARMLSEQLSYQTSHDELTGLINRRGFEDRLHTLLDMAKAEQSEHALCYLDLDQFKIINDTCGHIAGDELLRQLGRSLKKHVRKHDTLARLGGDEFGILVQHCSIEQAMRVANAVREAIEAFRFVWEGQQFKVGVSIGLVPIVANSGSITSVLSAADAACYEAKDAGRNRIKEYRQEDTGMRQRHGDMQLVIEIDRALETDRFEFYYQAITALQQHEASVSHFEILLRMRDRRGELISPGVFLGVAERFNLAMKLDRWVISNAFQWLASHPEQLDRLGLCAINLSGHSVADPEFHDFLIRQFDETEIPPQKICFEITETAAITNLNSATNLISFLKELGCKFALDDFGSGLSSFGYLKNLPVDFLKIDGEFVRDITRDPIHLAMIRSINDIGHVMGKKTIAEFVESEAILDELRTIGVDYAQGYHLGKPRPLQELVWQTHVLAAG